MKKYTFKEILDWHEKVFPEATLEGQKKKLEEELLELFDATEEGVEDKVFEEFADCIIVAVGMSRFSNTASMLALSAINELAVKPFKDQEDGIAMSCAFLKEIEKAVDKKMAENVTRTWAKKGGKYKHCDQDEEPKEEKSCVKVIRASSIEEALDEIRKVMQRDLGDK
jgi:uncharacterized protein YabN with tetrapyrrole methylase and pyrophosphatase domain